MAAARTETPATNTAEELEQLRHADREVEAFIDLNQSPSAVTKREPIRAAVEAFVKLHGRDHRIALVTSGGTVAPLEQQEIRHVTNLSTGQRGAASAEWFLRQGYAVVYFHKTGCLVPFARHFQSGGFLDDLTWRESSTDSAPCFSDVCAKAMEEHRRFVSVGNLLLSVPLHTVVDYQLGMKTILEAIRDTLLGMAVPNARTMVYLVSAVADFYIPFKELPKEKIDSRPDDPSMTIHLKKVPKALARGLVGRLWGDGAFVTTFKLETDESRIDAKVLKHINGFDNIRLVASNLHATLRSEMKLHDTRRPLEPVTIRKPDNGELEEELVARVVAKHDEFINGSW